MAMTARSRVERHGGEWISIATHIERAPFRFTLTFAFGDLPEAWHESRRRASTWSGIVGLVLLAPFIPLAAAALLRTVGIAQPDEWLAGSPTAIIEASISLFVRIPAAIAVDWWRLPRLAL